MLPSQSLLSPADFKSPVAMPTQEYIAGLHHLTTASSDRPVRTFRSKADAIAAYKRGEISAADPVRILG